MGISKHIQEKGYEHSKLIVLVDQWGETNRQIWELILSDKSKVHIFK